MPTGHASKDMKFKADDSGGTLRDLTQYLDKADLNLTAQLLETSSYGADNTTFISGQKGGTIAIAGRWDATIDGYLFGHLGGDEFDFEFFPNGDAAGRVKYSGKAVMGGHNISTARGSKVGSGNNLTITGAVTRATV